MVATLDEQSVPTYGGKNTFVVFCIGALCGFFHHVVRDLEVNVIIMGRRRAADEALMLFSFFSRKNMYNVMPHKSKIFESLG